MARKSKGINAKSWFYGQSFVSSGYTQGSSHDEQRPSLQVNGTEHSRPCDEQVFNTETVPKPVTTPYEAMRILNSAVGYLQTLPEFTAEAQNILADARKRVATANLKRQDWLRKQAELEDKYPIG